MAHTVFVPTGRFPQGIYKKDLSFTLNFRKKNITLDDNFDICVFLVNEEDDEFQVTLTSNEISLVKVIDDENGDKTIEEFIEKIISEEMLHLKNKTQFKKGLYHYNNGDWEQTENLSD
ncbi:247L [Invertebrate iridescent virus Kaz2018]|uniref:Uncharacterized protein 247L n=1 Tax=Invertebrate iridescent virus 6 TaxID=176652 RepID=247L_IIV6|nr:247L [Invertebrate iridescent virus 6]Q91FS5.1 RecName: Full=Uncharacterized protein 247L [Invertebrate iridescent virus 6]AAK82108.1 247L [Invertebrate iridescent virus 6]QMS79688.1 hypothetical protein IIV6-T1_242 [Invertebrate iridescent virus 6]QNH08657.1 247L [Invertebrate iridescent virus Kaz2018]